MRDTKKLLKRYLAVFLGLLLFLSPVISSVSDAASNSSTSTSTLSAKSGDYVYYSVYNKIYRINTKTKKKKLILHKKNWWSFDDMVVYKGYIYAVADTCQGTGEDHTYIYRVKTDGTKGKLLDKGNYLNLYNGKIYYKKYSYNTSNFYDTFKEHGIYRMNLDGSGKKAIKSSSSIYDFKIYKSNIYYYTANNLYCISTSGTKNTKLCSFKNREMISIYNGDVYYNKYGVNNVYRYNLSSKKTYKVVSNGTGFDVKNGYIYYTTSNSSWTKGYIYKKNLSTKKSTLITSKKSIYGASLEGNYIIYSSPGPNMNKNTRLNIIKNNGKENTTLADYFVS